MKSWRNASCKWWPSWWSKKIGGNAMENTFQQYEKLWKGTRKIKLAVFRKEQFFLRPPGTHVGHVCDESDVLSWDCTELKWGRAKALLLKIFQMRGD